MLSNLLSSCRIYMSLLESKYLLREKCEKQFKENVLRCIVNEFLAEIQAGNFNNFPGIHFAKDYIRFRINTVLGTAEFSDCVLSALNESLVCLFQSLNNKECRPPVPGGPAIRQFGLNSMLNDFNAELNDLRSRYEERVSLVLYMGAIGTGKSTWTAFIREQSEAFNIFPIPSLSNMTRCDAAMNFLTEKIEKDGLVSHTLKMDFIESFALFVLEKGRTASNKIDDFAKMFCKSQKFSVESLTFDPQKDIIFLYDETSLGPDEDGGDFQRRASSPSFESVQNQSKSQSGEVFLFEGGIRSNPSKQLFPLSGTEVDKSDTSVLTTLSRAFMTIMDRTAGEMASKNRGQHSGPPRITVCCASGHSFYPVRTTYDTFDGTPVLINDLRDMNKSKRLIRFFQLSYSGKECNGRCTASLAGYQDLSMSELDKTASKLASEFFCCYLYSEVVEILNGRKVTDGLHTLSSCSSCAEALSMVLSTGNYLSHFSLQKLHHFLKTVCTIVSKYDEVKRPRKSHSTTNASCALLLNDVQNLCQNSFAERVCSNLTEAIGPFLPNTVDAKQQTIGKLLLAGVSGIAVDTTRPLVRTMIRASLFVNLMPLIPTEPSKPTSQVSISMMLGTLMQLSKFGHLSEAIRPVMNTVCDVNQTVTFWKMFENIAFAHMHVILLLLKVAFPTGAVFDKNVMASDIPPFTFGIHMDLHKYFSVPSFLQWKPFPTCCNAGCSPCTENTRARHELCSALCIEGKVFNVTKEETETTGNSDKVAGILRKFLANNARQGENCVPIHLCKGSHACPGFDSFVALLTEATFFLFLCEAKLKKPETDLTKTAIKVSSIQRKFLTCQSLVNALKTDLQNDLVKRKFCAFFVLQSFGDIKKSSVCQIRNTGTESTDNLTETGEPLVTSTDHPLHLLERTFRPGEVGHLQSLVLKSGSFPAECILSLRQKKRVKSTT